MSEAKETERSMKEDTPEEKKDVRIGHPRSTASWSNPG